METNRKGQIIMEFTCIECEDKYIPNVNGDAEERMCHHCLIEKQEEKEV